MNSKIKFLLIGLITTFAISTTISTVLIFRNIELAKQIYEFETGVTRCLLNFERILRSITNRQSSIENILLTAVNIAATVEEIKIFNRKQILGQIHKKRFAQGGNE